MVIQLKEDYYLIQNINQINMVVNHLIDMQKKIQM